MQQWEYATLAFRDGGPTKAHVDNEKWTWITYPDGKGVTRIKQSVAGDDATVTFYDKAGKETETVTTWLSLMNEMGAEGWEAVYNVINHAALTASAPNGGSYYISAHVATTVTFKRPRIDSHE